MYSISMSTSEHQTENSMQKLATYIYNSHLFDDDDDKSY